MRERVGEGWTWTRKPDGGGWSHESRLLGMHAIFDLEFGFCFCFSGMRVKVLVGRLLLRLGWLVAGRWWWQ